MIATSAAVALLVLATAACLVLVVPTLAGLLPARGRGANAPAHTFAILIPAHNEEASLPATLRSLGELTYPAARVRVWVVADNCTDSTPSVAWAFGATCVARFDRTRRGKGHAVAFGLERVLRDAADVVLVLDADCELNTAGLQALDAVFAGGADAAQCTVRSRNADAGPTGYVAAVGAALDAAAAAGRDRLGASVPLRGTGMAFRRSVLEFIPWTAFGLAEDAEYAEKLHAAGVRVRHCADAVVSCDSPGNWRDLGKQRRRWRAAGVLASKPLGLALIGAAAALGFACRFVWWPATLLVLTAAVYGRAVLGVGVTSRRLGLLLKSPAIVARLAWVASAGRLKRSPKSWDRTPRPSDAERRAA
ncbi:glycosyltransferase family 2 protein [Gemmata sp.]|uniref:glycosyltransferase family 2 protein n=1 Tax=Gemmata sp. TaxID=1914242 RepID=UPI003F7240D1